MTLAEFRNATTKTDGLLSRCCATVLTILVISGNQQASAATSNTNPRAIVELFTSQGCSSCPPADKILGELAKDPSVIALSLPVDYWDYLGWKDTLADSRFSARQKSYARVRRDRNMFTPQMIVNGTAQVNGSDRPAIEAAMTNSREQNGVMTVPVAMKQDHRHLRITIPAASGAAAYGEIWICAVSRKIAIKIGRGENRDREMTYHNVVRNVLKVGDWTGAAGSWDVPLENILHDDVDAVAVYVQYGSREKPGPMLGAAFKPLN